MAFSIFVTSANTFAATIFSWGSNGAGQTNVPPGLTNVVAIAAGDYHSLALRADGTVVAWGLNSYGATNVPPDLTNAVAVGGGLWHSLALRSDGTLEGWGDNSFSMATPPVGLSNVVAIACGMFHNLALKNDGTVVAWGDPSYGCTTVPDGLTNVIAVAGGYYLSLALKADGTVVAWGEDFSGMAEVPPGLTNVQAISSQCLQTLALNGDGTVANWGYLSNVPPGVSNVIAVASGGWTSGAYHSLVLKNDGSLFTWGTNSAGEGAVPPGLPNVAAIAAGSAHNLVLLDNPTPHFSQQPVGQTVYSGVDVLLRSIAFGPGALAYQWQLNGTNLSGATSNNLVLPNAQPANSGNYTVVVTNNYGSVTSFTAVLQVVASPPMVTILSSTNVNLTSGSSNTLLATAAGSLPIHLQWQKNGTDISGATNLSLTLSNVLPADSGVYTLVATNQYGATSSVPTSLSVYGLAEALNDTNDTWTTFGGTSWYPQLSTTHDGFAAAQSDSVNGSESSTLQTVVNGPATLSFWWKFFPDGAGDTFNFYINGTRVLWTGLNFDWTQSTFYLGAGPQTLQWVRVKGSPQYVYESAWVDEVNVVPGTTAPIFTTLPSSATVSAGSNPTFSAGTVGTPPLIYQWQFAGTNITGATNASFTLTDAQAGNAGQYTVTVTNVAGSASTNCTLIVTTSVPHVTIAPASLRVVANATAAFTATAVGSEPFTFQWKFNGTNIDGATLPVLTISPAQVTNSGVYSVAVTNAYGGVSNGATLAVLSPTMVIGFGGNSYGQINFPANLTNAVEISAGYYHTLVRKSDGTLAAYGENSYGESSIPAGLSNIVAISAGGYQNMVLRSDGTVTNWGYNVRQPPAQLTNVVAISAGGSHYLALKPDGTVVSWGINNYGQTNVPAGLSNIVAVAAGGNFSLALDAGGHVFGWGDNTYGQTNIPPALSNVVAIAGGYNHCVALKDDGTVVAWGENSQQQTNVPPGLTNVIAISAKSASSMALKADGTMVVWGNVSPGINPGLTNTTQTVAIAVGATHAVAILSSGAPFIWQQPLSRSVFAGSTVTFRLAALGVPILSYQWQFDGTNIDGATNSTLVLTNVPLTSAGAYQCLVTNSLGAVTSRPANLTVWRSTPQFQTGAALLSTGFNLPLAGLSGHGDIILYASSNLIDWTPVLTNDPVTGAVMLFDSGATNMPARFYRAVEQ